MRRRLLLFDVDGTLIKRGDPEHLAAIDYGVHTVFPESTSATVHNVDYDGKVDRLIAAETLGLAGIDIAPEDPSLDPIFELAGAYYRERWNGRSGGENDLLPGVQELIDRLAGDDEFTLGVMSGGSREIVAAKLDRLSLASSFPFGSFGSEAPNRPALVPVAMTLAEEYAGARFAPDQALVIGDTPADVHCAHVHDIRCLAVATGKYSEAELRSANADAVLSNLLPTDDVVTLIKELTSE
jgi:phosphoglycolate phosphatase